MTSNHQVDSTEQYYAHMESDRNDAEQSYFKARPQEDTKNYRKVFCAGFERAYQLLWNDLQSSRGETARACQGTRETIARETSGMRESHAEIGRLRSALEGADKTIAHFMGPHGQGYISKFEAAVRVVMAWDESRVHLSKGGKNPNDKLFSARDVEALIAVAMAGERAASEVSP